MADSAPQFPEIDLKKLATRSLTERTNLVDVSDFARAVEPDASLREFLGSLPNILAGKRLRQLAGAIAQAHKGGKLVACALGGHVIKCGLSPILIDLMERKILGALALNGASAIHDYEVATIGATSEDANAGLQDGSFGTARETAEAFRKAVRKAKSSESTLGEALGDIILEENRKHMALSLLAVARRLRLPVTVHVAWGTDVVHMHEGVLGQDLGEVCARDFKRLCSIVAALDGGVWLNIGSAVVLPEVFLKAFTVARNLGHKLDNLTTCNLDMYQHYRPQVNVLDRPAKQGIHLSGHHEILLPLVRLAILTELEAHPSKGSV